MNGWGRGSVATLPAPLGLVPGWRDKRLRRACPMDFRGFVGEQKGLQEWPALERNWGWGVPEVVEGDWVAGMVVGIAAGYI